ncbi:MAG TPA: efflux RND transporter periplasmic adaptor subunit [Gemmatimonadaceae bacterium]|nr:efflux RND transporter periplasmic adaptor subunit [Gemmatimonadaceae bacterium]
MPNYHRIFISVLAVAACRNSDAKPAASPDAVRAVRTAAVTFDTTPQPVTGTGVLAARDEVQLAFKVGGIIARLSVREGQTVTRGQVIAALDLREIDAQVAKARSAVTKAERDAERARTLYSDSVVTLAQMQDAATALEVAQADLEAARFNRQYATIVAPAAGTILRRHAEPGELVTPGTPIVTLASSAGGRVFRIGLTDHDLMRVRLGAPATVRFDALPGRTFAGTVREIAAAATPGTGTYAVEIALPSASSLATGLVGRGLIETSIGERTAVVPIEAIVEADGDRASVFVVDSTPPRARRVPVAIVYLRDPYVGVRGPLDSTATVATEGAAYLDDGMAVKVVP